MIYKAPDGFVGLRRPDAASRSWLEDLNIHIEGLAYECSVGHYPHVLRLSGTPAAGLTLGLEFESDRRNNGIIFYRAYILYFESRSFLAYKKHSSQKRNQYAWFHHVANARWGLAITDNSY